MEKWIVLDTAQYCSYTFMEYETKTILCIITMDKRVTEKKSTNLEKACFLKGINMLIDSGLHIVELWQMLMFKLPL